MKNIPVTNLVRIERLEKESERIDLKLDTIMENHLPHIQIELESIKTRVNVLALINVGALVLALLVSKFL